MYIAFEGIDGAGKSTQAKLLQRNLAESSENIISTLVKEPMVTDALSKKITYLIKHPPSEMSAFTEALLFMAVRSHLIEKTVLPVLVQKGTIISDRSLFSTMAYQSARGVPLGAIGALIGVHQIMWPTPNLVFFLDIPVELSIERTKGKTDRFEETDKQEKERIIGMYKQMAAIEDEEITWVTIDGSQPEKDMANQIFKSFSEKSL